ncbi:uncharacterized protein LOC141595661 [Silene latifolia]|uniref:uncharacterized protein LOC141595661 n=1 Tax=Silene latifolia TaxID=37657 RepID=UPI003D78414E
MEISRNSGVPWFLTAVYASPDPQNRRELWLELADFAKRNNHPWMVAGDFNETRSLTERHGRDANMARRCDMFNNWIEDCELIELEFSGAAHTWSRGNSIETRQSARLDRALCNSEWSLMFSNASVKHLPAIQSDHCRPLLISPNGFAPLSSIQRPFRFQAAWLTHENFSDFVIENWQPEGDLTAQLDSKKRELWARISGCQRKLAITRDKETIVLEAKLRKELDEVLEREEILWYQKSRVDFIRDGGRNTSYFHVSTLVRRWRNRINSLKDNDGVWVEEKNALISHVVEFYKKLYTQDGDYDVNAEIPYNLFPELSNEDFRWLTRPYTEAEIEGVIHNMGALKAPGPDGFQALFYQKNWEVVRQ